MSVGREETRFEAQGYRTPEDFCTAVVQHASAHIWSPPLYPPTTPNWTVSGVIGLLVVVVVMGLIAAIIASVILFLL